MKHVALFIVLLWAVSVQGQTFTFPTTQNPISQSGTWISGGAAGSNCGGFVGQCWNDVQIINAIAANTGTNSGCTGSVGSDCNDASAALTGTWASNEQACGVVTLSGGLNRSSTDEIEIRLNVVISNQSITGYEATYSTKASPNQYAGFNRWNGPIGNFTPIGTSGTVPALTSGDSICASNVNGALTEWIIHSGVRTTVANATDTTFTNGSPGIGFYNQGTPSDNGQYGFSSYTVSNPGGGGGGGGGTFTAASANETDVNAVINGPTHVAVNGDIIQIPCSGSQTVTWASALSTTASIKITALGGTPNTGPSTFGSGTNCLTILVTGGPVFSFNPTFASTNNVSTLENINIDPSGTSLTSPVFFNGTCTASGCPLMRMDNIYFGKSAQWTEGGNCGVTANCNWLIRANNIFGVIDHVTTPTGTKVDLLSGGLDSYLGVGGFGDNSWATPDTFGTQSALYIENSVLTTNQEFTDCEKSPTGTVGGGCRLVGRFNHLSTDPAQLFIAFGVHGLETGGRTRGGRQIEVYNNTLNCLAVNGCSGGMVSYRGGTGFTFNNTLTGNRYNSIGNGTVFRVVFSATPWSFCGGLNSKNPWDTNDNVVYYSGTVTAGGGTTATDSTKTWTVGQFDPPGAPYTFYDVTQNFGGEIASNNSNTVFLGSPISEQPWSVNVNDSYQIIRATVCGDQAGRGQGILLSGSSPTPVAPLNEALDPIYVWNNPATAANVNFTSTDTNKIIANRDYYADTNTATPLGPQTSATSPFNGTGAGGLGVGFGTLARRPPCTSGCLIGVGYFATDQGNWNQSGSGGQGVLYTLTAPGTWSVHYTPFTYPHPLASGTGPPQTPAVSISPSSLSFGTSTSPQTVTATSTGTANLVMSTPPATITGDFSVQAISGQCTSGQSLAAPSFCLESIGFTPTAIGARSGTLSIFDNVTGSPQTVALTGTGIATAAVSPSALVFGNVIVGQSLNLNVTLQNTGNTAMSVTSIAMTGTYYSQTNNCTPSLGAGLSCTITVNFAPLTPIGVSAGTLTITDNSSTGSTQTVGATGSGILVATTSTGVTIQGSVIQ